MIRINFDTLYSWLILELSTPATFTLPETDGRYQSTKLMKPAMDVLVLLFIVCSRELVIHTGCAIAAVDQHVGEEGGVVNAERPVVEPKLLRFEIDHGCVDHAIRDRSRSKFVAVFEVS